MEEFDTRVRQVIEEIRPFLQNDGGDVELVEIVGKSAKVRLTGHCAHCPGAQMTLRHGIQRTLKERIPEFDQVIPV